MSIGLILVIILIIILLGGIGGPYVNPNWQYGYGSGHYGMGIIGIVLVVLLILILLGRF